MGPSHRHVVVAIHTLHSDIGGVTASDAARLSGRTVSHFRVLEQLGAGGMGVVYRGEDVTLGRTVALKFMLPEYTVDETAAARFLREARSVATLDHPNICTVHEAGRSDDGHLFLAMSYYAGETLKDRLTSAEALPVAQALDIAAQIARGLTCAHAAGIVHRDLKPANILFRADGRPVIVDFGLAKDLGAHSTLTIAGQLLATPRYMSPEQCLNLPVDGRSDLYSLGVIFYEMLTGLRLYDSANPASVVNMHVNAPVPKLPAHLAEHQALLDGLLAKKPEARFQSADAVARLISR